MLGRTEEIWRALDDSKGIQRKVPEVWARKVVGLENPLWLHTPPSSPLTAGLDSKNEERPRPRRALVLVYLFSRGVGILPLRYNYMSQKLEMSRWGVVYSVTVIIIFFILTSFMNWDIYINYMAEGKVLSGLEPVVLTTLNSALMLLSLTRVKRLSEVIRMLAELEMDLSPRKNSGPGMLPCTIPAVLCVITCIVDIASSLAESTLLDTVIYLPYYWVSAGAVAVETQFTVACLTFRYWVWLLNQQIKTIRRRTQGAALRLEGLRLTHARLCDAAVLLDEAFGPQLLLACALCFTGTVVNAYFGVNGYYDSGVAESAGETLQNLQWVWAVFYLTRVAIICLATTRLQAQSVETGRLVHALADRRLRVDMKEEIELFSMQINSSKIEFSACGMFPVDFTLFFAIVSSTTTYLIILIQYRPV